MCQKRILIKEKIILYIYHMKFMKLSLALVICFAFACSDHAKENTLTKKSMQDSTSYTITKLLNVSPKKVYNAYLDPQALKIIWGVDSITIDAKPEGKAHAILRIGAQNWDFTLTYKEVIPDQKLKWVAHFDHFPKIEVWTTVVFNSVKEGTELSFSQENFSTKAERDENQKANTGAIEKLRVFLSK